MNKMLRLTTCLLLLGFVAYSIQAAETCYEGVTGGAKDPASDTFTELEEPLFPISGASGCGSAKTSDGQQQVVIASKGTRTTY